MGAGRWRKPHHRHDRQPARLGGLAPARLGRADRHLRRTRRPNEILHDEAVNRRIADAFETRRRRRLVRGRRRRSASLARHDAERLRQDRRRPRRLVRFRLDPCLHAGRPEAFPGPRGHPPQARRRARYGHVSRRLGPASRLVPVLAAGKLRHARPRALTTRADAWLRSRREGPENVEVARQRHRAAEPSSRMRAPISCGSGWRRPIIPTICASARKS